MTARTDPHRPGAIVPEHYAYCFSYAAGGTEDGWPVPPINVDLALAEMHGPHCAPLARQRGCFQCTICGARFRTGDCWRYLPTEERIFVGHDCADKYQLLADRSDFDGAQAQSRAETAAARLRAEHEAERRAFLDAHPGLESALETDHRIIEDIRFAFRRFRSLSEKQVALVTRLAHEAAAPAERKVAPPSGRMTLLGRVLSTKTEQGQYGTSYKWTLRIVAPLGGVWIGWGTVPESLLLSVEHVAGVDLSKGYLAALRGLDVELTATVVPREVGFALLKRPTAAKIVEAPDAASMGASPR